MSALASLSKFQGRYDQWLQIRQRYNLKWSAGNESLQAMERFFNPQMSLDHMIAKVREMMGVLPPAMAGVIRFACLTGLRPSEACESVRLINSQTNNYFNPEQQCLEHFRFPEIFLRPTKKAFISYLSRDNYQRIANLGCKILPTWNSIRLTCRRRNINMDMRLCRKIDGSWLHKHGIASEAIDFLQGRANPYVFGRHYLTPSQDLGKRVLEATERLNNQLNA